MDKLDQWMNRAFGEAPTQKDSEKKDSPRNEKRTTSGNNNKPSRKRSSGSAHNSNQKSAHKHGNYRGPHNKEHNKKHTQNKSHADNKGKKHQPLPKMPAKTNKSPLSNIVKGAFKIIPLGGLDEVGKNMMAIEYEDDIIVIDMGFEFPSEDMLGIDYVIPDVSYLEENKHRIRGVLLTHGHLDHIGGIPYIIPKLDFPPLYGGRLTMGLVQQRVKEFKQEKEAKLRVIDPEKPLKLGKIVCKFFRVAHSIPDAFGIVLETPAGKIVHTGDFKFDPSPARNMALADVNKIEQLGKENVLALFCESTNSGKTGHTISEKEVGEALDRVIGKTKGRCIVASFSSQIGRLQQIIDAAARHNRRIYISGRSMRQNIETASKLGYLQFPKDLIWDIKEYPKSKTPDHQTLIITTGSQGEAVSALSRISRNEHPQIKAKKGDTIILSSSPIIGNERAINKVINNLCMIGAQVIHNQMEDIHTSGHAKQEELIRMITSIKPKYLIPVHGEYYMRQQLGTLAQEECGMPEENIIIIQNGDILLAGNGKLKQASNSIETKYILIDGRGEGHVGSQVQVEREIMSLNGAVILLIQINKKSKRFQNIDVVTRGFIYMHETESVAQDISRIAAEAYKNIMSKNPGAKRFDVKRYIMQKVDKYTTKNLERRPLVIPLLIDK